MDETNIFEVREEPIKVAEMLIYSSYEVRNHPIAILFGAPEKGHRPVYSKDDLREMAKHLLAYCEHGEGEE